MSTRLRLYAPQPLPPDSDYDTILEGSWDVETRECMATTEWKVSFSTTKTGMTLTEEQTMIEGRHFHLGTILNPVWVDDPRVGRGYKLEDDNKTNMELMPIVHTSTFSLGRSTDNFIKVVHRESCHDAALDGLKAARSPPPAVSTSLPGTEPPVSPLTLSLTSTAAGDDIVFASTFSTFDSLRDAIDELENWPPLAPEDIAIIRSTAVNPYTTQGAQCLDAHPKLPCPESEASTSEPVTPDDEVDELASQLRAIKGERTDELMEGLYRDIDEVAAAWSFEDDEEPENLQDTTTGSTESTMGALLQEVGEALLEWSVPGAGIGEA